MMIRFLRVTKQFGDSQPAIKDVSFEIEAGNLVVITGPSGSGKTTLLRLLTKEYDPTQGEIYFQDEHLNSLKDSQVAGHRRKIGAVFQDYKLLPELNVWENLALALSIIHRSDSEIAEKVTDLLKLVGLEDKAYLFPHQLSGGEAQRISIARALSTAPKVIFADEPTGNLDAVTSLTIAKLLRKINQLGTTVLVTTHDPVVMKELAEGRKLNLEKGVLKSDSDKTHIKSSTSSKKSSELTKNQSTHQDQEKSASVSAEKIDFDSIKKNQKAELEKAESTKTEAEFSSDQEKKSKKGFFGFFSRQKKSEQAVKPSGKDSEQIASSTEKTTVAKLNQKTEEIKPTLKEKSVSQNKISENLPSKSENLPSKKDKKNKNS